MRKLARVALLLRNAAGACKPAAEAGPASAAERPLPRFYAKLPAEYEKYYDAAQPARRAGASTSGAVEAAGSPTPALAAASDATPAIALEQQQRENAAAVSRWMLPWERRQMSGEQGPLRTWERYYWFVFVGALALLLFNRLPGQASEPADPEAEREKEQRKLKAARLLLAGQLGSEDDDDEFEGLTPQEIQAYVDKALGTNASADPFEGMSPEEINAMLEGRAK